MSVHPLPTIRSWMSIGVYTDPVACCNVMLSDMADGVITGFKLVKLADGTYEVFTERASRTTA